MKRKSTELQKLENDASAAYRRGRVPEAKAFLLEALERAPRSARTHHLLANVSLRQGDPAAAGQYARRAVELDGANLEYHDTLARALRRSGGAPAALDEFRRKASNEPVNFGAAYGLSLLLLAAGRGEEIKKSLDRTRELSPDTPEARLRVTKLYVMAKRYGEASRLLAHIHAAGDDSAELHGMAGKCFLEMNRPKKAAQAYEKALRHTGADLNYHAGLSVALSRSGQPDEARRVTAECLERFPGTTRAAMNPEAQVLVISALGMGYFEKLLSGPQNFERGNTSAQIPARRFTMHYILINHPDPVAAARSLGQIDLIVNNVANAEIAEATGFTAKVRETVDALGVPVINAPEAVARTTRARNAETLPEAAGIVFPGTIPYSLSEDGLQTVKDAILQAFSCPLLLRRTHTNHDTDIKFVADEAGLNDALRALLAAGVETIYAIDYIAEEYRPGIYRKFRCALIDGKFFPVHLDFSPDWNVHRPPYGTVENELMKSNQDLMDHEHAFIRDPQGSIGARNIERLEALGQAVGLDFIGVDFNILASGDLVVFEANPAMNLIEKRKVEAFPYFADYWERNLIAFEEMFLRKAGKL